MRPNMHRKKLQQIWQYGQETPLQTRRKEAKLRKLLGIMSSAKKKLKKNRTTKFTHTKTNFDKQNFNKMYIQTLTNFKTKTNKNKL